MYLLRQYLLVIRYTFTAFVGWAKKGGTSILCLSLAMRPEEHCKANMRHAYSVSKKECFWESGGGPYIQVVSSMLQPVWVAKESPHRQRVMFRYFLPTREVRLDKLGTVYGGVQYCLEKIIRYPQGEAAGLARCFVPWAWRGAFFGGMQSHWSKKCFRIRAEHSL